MLVDKRTKEVKNKKTLETLKTNQILRVAVLTSVKSKSNHLSFQAGSQTHNRLTQLGLVTPHQCVLWEMSTSLTCRGLRASSNITPLCFNPILQRLRPVQTHSTYKNTHRQLSNNQDINRSDNGRDTLPPGLHHYADTNTLYSPQANL